ncbi:MAG: acyltransferase family protein [Oscillospiraceae bacterium]|nr:acyltransferase family protein [Oscillospiraceae bacterium]
MVLKKRTISLDILKLFTILLIINSHSDVLYPSKIQFLASGGGIGNELFFLISGYLFSAKVDIPGDLRKRFARLYLPTYIMIIITWIFGKLELDSVSRIIGTFIWPTKFWFVGAIFLYSFFLYALIKHGIRKTKRFVLFGITVLIVDLLLYILLIPDKSVWIVEDVYFGFVPYRSIYSIFAFVLGYYLKMNKERLVGKIKESHTVVIAVVLFLGFYGFKFLLNKNIIPMSMQIFSHPLTIISALFIFLAFAQLDLNSFLEGKKVEHWINILAGLSLESYLVQFLIIGGIAYLNILFPMNFIICILAVLIAAWILHWVSGKLTGLILKRRE